MVNYWPELRETNGINIFWMRRDLRLYDNAALYHALKSPEPVLVVFIFDKDILERLSDVKDKRVNFIHNTLCEVNRELHNNGSSLLVLHDVPLAAFEKLTSRYDIRSVFINRDYEPYALQRDLAVEQLLKSKEIGFRSFKDQVIFEKSEVMKPDGSPYTVFTPYSKKWKHKFIMEELPSYPVGEYTDRLVQIPFKEIPALEKIGFKEVKVEVPEVHISEKHLRRYTLDRNFPGVEGTSNVSVHLRFGTLSIRELVSIAKDLEEQWLNELIWREFFMMILYHFPKVVNSNFRKKYDRIQWRNNEKEFELWCKGKTGYALVDAGMRQLNETGYMHNRVRMVTAGFLTKHLLIDWRWGEAYFAEKLLDFELSSNNGNWQWAAGTGCDAAPYFRIFNPVAQLKKFDPRLDYVKKWIPDYREGYLSPVVEHGFARERALETYKRSLAAL